MGINFHRNPPELESPLDHVVLRLGIDMLFVLSEDSPMSLVAIGEKLRDVLGKELWESFFPYLGYCWMGLPDELRVLVANVNVPTALHLDENERLNTVLTKLRQKKGPVQLILPLEERDIWMASIASDLAQALREAEDSQFRHDFDVEVLKWIRQQRGSAPELVAFITYRFGASGRAELLDSLARLRTNKELDRTVREYLADTLGDAPVAYVLQNGIEPADNERSTIDELLGRSAGVRASQKFAEVILFTAKFKNYSPFNNMLVYAQNPLTTYFATEKDWGKKFSRRVKEDARGMVILAPKTPVLLVYDLDDTEGPPLPEKLEEFTQTHGKLDEKILAKTIENAKRHEIRIDFKPMGQLYGGFATTTVRPKDAKMRIAIREQLSQTSRYSVMCHELAHIFLGHLGGDQDGWWPSRRGLSKRIVEVEAEAVSYIVCSRRGIETKSPEYLASFVRHKSDLAGISIDLISRVAGRIESMSNRLQPVPARKPKSRKQQ